MPKKEEFFTIKSIEQIMKLQKVKAQIEAIQKWDGQLPNVTGETIPFINVDTARSR